jgi:hypothetical protein
MAQLYQQRLFQGIVLLMGLLVLAVALAASPVFAQEPFTLDVTITNATVNSQTGQVTISGTVTCTEPAAYSLSLGVTQYVGRTNVITGSTYTSGTCAGPQGSTFTAVVYGSNGRFGPGQARIDASVYGCAGSPYPGPYPYPGCDIDQETVNTRLRQSR